VAAGFPASEWLCFHIMDCSGSGVQWVLHADGLAAMAAPLSQTRIQPIPMRPHRGDFFKKLPQLPKRVMTRQMHKVPLYVRATTADARQREIRSAKSWLHSFGGAMSSSAWKSASMALVSMVCVAASAPQRSAPKRKTSGSPRGGFRGPVTLAARAEDGPDAQDYSVELDRIFDWIDLDSNGQISFEEFLIFADYCGMRQGRQECSAKSAVEDAELRFVFNEADADKSGHLDKDEVGAILQRLGLLATQDCNEDEEDCKVDVSSLPRRARVWRIRRRAASRGMLRVVPFAPLRKLARQGIEQSVEFTKELGQGLGLISRQTALAWRLASSGFSVLGHTPLDVERRAVVRRATLDLAKLIPFLLLNLLVPGGSVVSVFLLRRCPKAVPSAFARARAAQENFQGNPTSPAAKWSNEFDEICVRTFSAFVREAYAREQVLRQALGDSPGPYLVAPA